METVDEAMKRQHPTTPADWLDEIQPAIAEAKEAEPFGRLAGEPITESNLFDQPIRS